MLIIWTIDLKVNFFKGDNKRAKKIPATSATGISNLKPDNDLLSHGETPHYHRR